MHALATTASPLAAFRWLWGRVLFAPGPQSATRVNAVAMLWLLIVPAALLYPRLDFFLLEPDEGRYAEIPREMLAHDSWVVPLLQAEPYLDKPPLMYWLVMLTYKLFGVHAAAARLVPAVAVHLTIFATYLLGRWQVGERAAFRGSMLLALSPGLAVVGRLLVLDGLLTLFVAVGQLAALASVQPDRSPAARRWLWLLAAIAAGLGGLTKGPVALVLILAPLTAFRLLQPAASRPVSRWAVAAFVGVALAINVPWYVAVCRSQPEFATYFFWKHNVQRFFAPFDHLEPVGYYAPILLGFLLPGTLYLWHLARTLVSAAPDRAAVRTPGLAACLLAGGGVVVLFSLSGSKLPTYILPALPALCLALGAVAPPLPQWPLVAWFVALLIGQHVALPWYAAHRSPMSQPDALRAACSDPNRRVICFPRHCDSVAFYLGRDDIDNFRTKESLTLVAELKKQRTTTVLFTHRHSLEALKYSLPPELKVVSVTRFDRPLPYLGGVEKAVGSTPWGLCDLAVIEYRP